MRVNPNPIPDVLAALANTQRDQETALLQIASGRRVTVPSDDPTAAAILTINRARSAQSAEFLQAISGAAARLQTADTTLSSVVTALQRAISLGIEGANGTLSTGDRASVAQELQGVQQQLLGLANTSFEGSFLFAGTADQAPPFVVDPTTPSGIRYIGNANTNKLQVGESLSVPVNLPGANIFAAAGADVFQSISDLTAAVTNNTGVDTAVSALRHAFDTVASQRVFYGNTIQQLDAQSSFLNSERLQLAQQENAVGGADMTVAASQLINAENARNAALQATGSLLRTNLFDFLR